MIQLVCIVIIIFSKSLKSLKRDVARVVFIRLALGPCVLRNSVGILGCVALASLQSHFRRWSGGCFDGGTGLGFLFGGWGSDSCGSRRRCHENRTKTLRESALGNVKWV